MLGFLAVLLALGLAGYVAVLGLWWPVLTDPNHFTDKRIAEREWVAWARTLVV